MDKVMDAVQELLDDTWSDAVKEVLKEGHFFFSEGGKKIVFSYMDDCHPNPQAETAQINLRTLVIDEFEDHAEYQLSEEQRDDLDRFVECFEALAQELRARLSKLREATK